MRDLTRMERLRNELKEEMIRKCKKETLEQPSLGRWARGEGGLEWDHQEDKEDKDCLISFLSCTVYSVQCTMYTLIPLSLVKANAPQTKLIACRTHVWEIKHIFWHFANLTKSDHQRAALSPCSLCFCSLVTDIAIQSDIQAGKVTRHLHHISFGRYSLFFTVSLFSVGIVSFFKVSLLLFSTFSSSCTYVLLLLTIILILLLLLYAFDQPRWLVHSWPGAQV